MNPKQGKDKLAPLAEYGETVVLFCQGKIAKADDWESE
jgi:hypothetical protein